MIEHISGKILSKQKNSITVSIGPIGLTIQSATPEIFMLNETITLFTHMHWNQEQGPTLFGFTNELERQVFLLVIGCSGIGPKIGLAVLRDLGAEPFLQAIQIDDEKTLATVGGLGPKKVEQMVVQLKRKVATLIKSGIVIENKHSLTDWQQVSDVLTSLNYSRSEITRAMKFLSETYSNTNTPFNGLIRHALSFLTKSR